MPENLVSQRNYSQLSALDSCEQLTRAISTDKFVCFFLNQSKRAISRHN